MSTRETFSSLEEEVSSTFVRRQHGDWGPADQAALEERLVSDSEYAQAYRRAHESLDILGTSADMPEMMRFRERALAHARLAAANRWFGRSSGGYRRWSWAASIAGAIIAVAVAWQFSPWGYQPGQYRTGIGEQRIVELDDHSRITLDATTRIAVRYTGESRSIKLVEGQAQFSVAKDPVRPFRVLVGDRTIVALGTVFTVDFTDRKIRVDMVEGRVAVVPDGSRPAAPTVSVRPPSIPQSTASNLTGLYPPLSSATTKKAPQLSEVGSPGSSSESQAGRGPQMIELSTGQELSVNSDGRAILIAQADIEAATAWRNGKVIFRTERVGDAVRRMNRYSRVQIEIDDPALADEPISGVFEAGDTDGFIRGVQLALPVAVKYADKSTVRLSSSR